MQYFVPKFFNSFRSGLVRLAHAWQLEIIINNCRKCLYSINQSNEFNKRRFNVIVVKPYELQIDGNSFDETCILWNGYGNTNLTLDRTNVFDSKKNSAFVITF